MTGPKLMKLVLTDIRWDEDVMSRLSTDPKIVEEYAAAGRLEDFPPIAVFVDAENVWGADGRHRYEAAKKRGENKVLCEVREGTREDAVWFAARSNLTHGVRPNAEDRKHAVRNILATPALRTKPDTVIAEQCGVAQATVATLRKQVQKELDKAAKEKAADEPKVDQPSEAPIDPPADTKIRTVKKADGRTYDINTANIGTGKTSKAKKAVLKKKVLKDAVGVEVPDWLRPVFVAAVDLDVFCTKLGSFMDTAEKLAIEESGAGGHIDLQTLADMTQEIRRHIGDARPFACCPDCVTKEGPSKHCKKCMGLGWLTHPQYDIVKPK